MSHHHEHKGGNPLVEGLVHMANVGDVGFARSEFGGSKGRSSALEGFELRLVGAEHGLGIEYMCHAANVGDMPYQANGVFQGSRGQSRQIEGIAVRLTGPAARNYDVYYTTHLAELGDTAVCKNGEYCGTKGQGRRMEGLRVWVERFVVPTVEGMVHLSDVGDVAFSGSNFAGTRGQSRKIEGFELRLNPSVKDLGIEYTCHAANVGDMPWQSSGFLGSRGQSRDLQGFAVRLTGPAASHYTVQYMAHLANKGDVPAQGDGAYVGTKGESRPMEGMHVWIARR
jgi:uncharacterized protein YjdB